MLLDTNYENFGWLGFRQSSSFKSENEDKGGLPSFVRKALRYTQLEANMHSVGVF